MLFFSWFIDEKMKTEGKTVELNRLRTCLKDSADNSGYSLELKTKSMRDREKRVVCKSFHGAGLVVPVDHNDVGYRELPETDGNFYHRIQPYP